MVNLVGINILDTAQTDPGRVLELVTEFDMAIVRIVHATHDKEPQALCKLLRDKRPQTAIVYRFRKDDMTDERYPELTAAQVVSRLQFALEMGAYGAVNNESLLNPMTPIARQGREILDICVPKGWRTAHMAVSTGNPGLGLSRDGRPDGYAEMDELWQAAGQVNKEVMDAGKWPLVMFGPHSYFRSSGFVSGLTDRHREIHRRIRELKALNASRGLPSAHLDTRYFPLFLGETGTAYITIDAQGGIHLDADRGYRNLGDQSISPEQYADLVADMIETWYAPDNAVACLFARGQSVGGRFWSFDLMGHDAFWKRLKIHADAGRLQAAYWYPYQPKPTDPPPPPPPPPIDPPPPVINPPVTPDFDYARAAEYCMTMASYHFKLSQTWEQLSNLFNIPQEERKAS